MSDISENSTDVSQYSTDDSGINITLGARSAGNDESNEQAISISNCSDVLAELFANHKKLKEAETQLQSLSLILEHDKLDKSNAGINHEVFEENKNFLEEEITKIKKGITDKELFLQTGDFKLFQYYTDSIKNAGNEVSGNVFQSEESIKHFQHKISLNGEASLPCDVEFRESVLDLPSMNESNNQWQNLESRDKAEIVKLRRALTETRQKQKEERDEIMKQLKALQITTVNGETNWRCVLREKQLKIDELTKKNTELQTKHAELDNCFKNYQKLKQKDKKEYERKNTKYEKMISSLKTQNSSIHDEINFLERKVKELRNSKKDSAAIIERLGERNINLEEDLCQKSQTLDEKNKLLEVLSREIQETNNLVNKLVIEVNQLRTDKENLNKHQEVFTTAQQEEQLKSEKSVKVLDNGNENKCCVHVGIQTEDRDCQLKNDLQSLKADLEVNREKSKRLVEELHEKYILLERSKKNETELQKDVETWKTKSIQNERTIQELAISFGKETRANALICEGQIKQYGDTKINKFSECMLEMLEEIKVELYAAQDDIIKHKKNVETLQKTWREYKSSVMDLNEEMQR